MFIDIHTKKNANKPKSHSVYYKPTKFAEHIVKAGQTISKRK